jgi:hypothetical protein
MLVVKYPVLTAVWLGLTWSSSCPVETGGWQTSEGYALASAISVNSKWNPGRGAR